MKLSAIKVLNVMKEKKNQGITFDDFPRGKEIRSRISELRYKGYVIAKEMETLDSGCRRARYWLISEPK